VSTVDLLPTFFSLAGGDVDDLETDGVDVLPHLTGDESGDPHEVLVWRHHDGRFAVRKGDWKLVSPSSSNPFARLQNIATHPNELGYFNAQQPAVVADLVHELTLWEARMTKAEWGGLGARTKNNFDHFVYRHEQGAAGVWSTAGVWLQGGTTNVEQLTPEDAYANATLEFRTNDSGDYTATNDMLRVTRYTFMLNELRFTGNHAAPISHSATINGNALLMVNNLEGEAPTLRVDATASGSGAFTFHVANEIQLLDNMVISGDGTQRLTIGGTIRDYYESRSVTKTGNSDVVLSGSNLFTGPLTVEAGRLSTAGLTGSLHLNGGSFGAVGTTNIGGNYVQSGGALEIELGATSDKLAIGGSASLAGQLAVSLAGGFVPNIGQVFTILSAAGRAGAFEELLLPTLADGGWSVAYSNNSVQLLVTLPGDFNVDGIVDAADYVAWQKGLVTGAPDQLATWQANFGRTFDYGSGQSAVPEPSTFLLAAIGLLMVPRRR
jgi:autotransporter-associated beta strand protein